MINFSSSVKDNKACHVIALCDEQTSCCSLKFVLISLKHFPFCSTKESHTGNDNKFFLYKTDRTSLNRNAVPYKAVSSSSWCTVVSDGSNFSLWFWPCSLNILGLRLYNDKRKHTHRCQTISHLKSLRLLQSKQMTGERLRCAHRKSAWDRTA